MVQKTYNVKVDYGLVHLRDAKVGEVVCEIGETCEKGVVPLGRVLLG